MSLKRPVVLDAANIAYCYGDDKSYETKGILLVVSHFLKEGHKPYIVIEHNRIEKLESRQDMSTESKSLMRQLTHRTTILFANGLIVRARKNRNFGDDEFILSLAEQYGGLVISRDNFSKQAEGIPDLKQLIETRVADFNFCGDIFHLRLRSSSRILKCYDDEIDYPKVILEQMPQNDVSESMRFLKRLLESVESPYPENCFVSVQSQTESSLTWNQDFNTWIINKVENLSIEKSQAVKNKFKTKYLHLVKEIDTFLDAGGEMSNESVPDEPETSKTSVEEKIIQTEPVTEAENSNQLEQKTIQKFASTKIEIVDKLEDDVLDDLDSLGANKSFDEIKKCIEIGVSSSDFTQLVSWLSVELKGLCGLEEQVHILENQDDIGSFLLELNSFLKELDCPISSLMEGAASQRLASKEQRLHLLNYLITELQAAKMISANSAPVENDTKIAKIQESETAGGGRNWDQQGGGQQHQGGGWSGGGGRQGYHQQDTWTNQAYQQPIYEQQQQYYGAQQGGYHDQGQQYYGAQQGGYYDQGQQYYGAQQGGYYDQGQQYYGAQQRGYYEQGQQVYGNQQGYGNQQQGYYQHDDRQGRGRGRRHY